LARTPIDTGAAMEHKLNFEPKLLKAVMIGSLIAWCLIISSSFLWNNYLTKTHTQEIITKEGRALFNKDKAFRFWAASHGGVYVPVSGKTPPNPFLEHVKERDVITPSGKKLTLMNPAYMIRQMMDEYEKIYGVKGHITSLIHYRPETAPDDWEKVVLKRFENGEKEVQEIQVIDGEHHMRYMQPLYVKKQCLKCHKKQGYEIGQVRGGVSLSLPLKKYQQIEKKSLRVLAFSHLVLFLLGSIIILVGYYFSRKYLRTSEKYRRSMTYWTDTFNHAQWGIAIVNIHDEKFEQVNNAYCDMLDYSYEQLIEMTFFDMFRSDFKKRLPVLIQSANEYGHCSFEAEQQRRDGVVIPVWIDITIIKESSGKLKARVVNIRDLSEVKEAERSLIFLNPSIFLENNSTIRGSNIAHFFL